MKLNIEEIQQVLETSNYFDKQENINALLGVFRNFIAEKEAEKEEDKKERVKYVPIAFSGISESNDDGMGYLVLLDENEDVGLIEAKIQSVIFNFNENSRKKSIKSFVEAFESIPPRFWKEEKMKIKTKEPIYFKKLEK